MKQSYLCPSCQWPSIECNYYMNCHMPQTNETNVYTQKSSPEPVAWFGMAGMSLIALCPCAPVREMHDYMHIFITRWWHNLFHHMHPKNRFQTVQMPYNMVEIWLRYEPISANHLCGYMHLPNWGAVAMQPLWDICGCTTLHHTATMTLERKWACAPAILGWRIFSVIFTIFPAFIGPISETKVFFPPLMS